MPPVEEEWAVRIERFLHRPPVFRCETTTSPASAHTDPSIEPEQDETMPDENSPSVRARSTPLAQPEYHNCRECGGSHQANNHLRQYAFRSRGERLLCTRCVNSGYAVCAECSSLETNTHATPDWGTDNVYCLVHRHACEDCGDRGEWPNGVCNSCGWSCRNCGGAFSSESVQHERGGWAYCDGCVGDVSVGVRGYGHTHPTRWFGGPLRRNAQGRQVGYYLGLELEISADRNDASPILDWEQANGLGGFFDCKEDGSVEGFEIATQPFTPQLFEEMMADGRWDSFFEMLNEAYPLDRYPHGEERVGHGLHVHIGRVAFRRDDVGLAAFTYLLGQDKGKHLERIARRDPTGYCERVNKPVSTTIVHRKQNTQQGRRLYASGNYPGRNAINLTSQNTVEIRAFRSTRSAQELADAVRLVYVGADYIRFLRSVSKTQGVDPKKLIWSEFLRWVAFTNADAFAGLAGIEVSKPVRVSQRNLAPATVAYALDETDAEPLETEWVAEEFQSCGYCGEENCTRGSHRRYGVETNTRRVPIPRGLAAIHAAPGRVTTVVEDPDWEDDLLEDESQPLLTTGYVPSFTYFDVMTTTNTNNEPF